MTDATAIRLIGSLDRAADRTADLTKALLSWCGNGNGSGNNRPPVAVADGFNDGEPHRPDSGTDSTCRWLLTGDVAALCRCHVQTVRRWCRHHKGPAVRRDADGQYARFWVADWLAGEWKTRIDALRGGPGEPPAAGEKPREDTSQDPDDDREKPDDDPAGTGGAGEG
jgi:hypothetical protein